ncbi:hypothetical protein PRSG_00024 [Prochlorococcus phage P-SSP3]|uniref:Uncharacterized protein n=1 Tax=Prochlorococcus phage P-SSP3 TaxID=382273 RepID=M1U3G8_9CAUD|nr:hypothetical protein PRSG_00024 [Prochlorococcus phage P-SSP3]AGG54578.1 hypothetical protein PRSG_00024 [Prochlorococcus phage P-SSP3]
MCAPTQTSPNYGAIKAVRNYSPAKQERFEAEVAKNQQSMKDKGYTPTHSGGANPFGGGPGAALGEILWAKKDSEKYPEPEIQRDPAFSLTEDAVTNQSGKKQKLKITNRSAVRTGNRKSKLNRSGGSGALRTSMKILNT